MRTRESGVFSSCDTFATKSLFSALSFRQRHTADHHHREAGNDHQPRERPVSTISSTRLSAALACSSSAERSDHVHAPLCREWSERPADG